MRRRLRCNVEQSSSSFDRHRCKKWCPIRALRKAVSSRGQASTSEGTTDNLERPLLSLSNKSLNVISPASGEEDGLATFESVISDHVLTLILGSVPEREVFGTASLVNRRWNRVVFGSSTWRHRVLPGIPESVVTELDRQESINRGVWARTYFSLYRTNLLRNPYFQDYYGRRCSWGNCVVRNCSESWCLSGETNGWRFPKTGGDGWQFEDPPLGLQPEAPLAPLPLPPWEQTCDLPRPSRPSCLAASHEVNIATQCINLPRQLVRRGFEAGLARTLLDSCPPLGLSVWYAGRVDCPSTCQLRVSLISACSKQLGQWRSPKLSTVPGAWTPLIALIDDYPPGVRYIDFELAGCDDQGRPGWYGPKFSSPQCHFVAPQDVEAYRLRVTLFPGAPVPGAVTEDGFFCSNYCRLKRMFQGYHI